MTERQKGETHIWVKKDITDFDVHEIIKHRSTEAELFFMILIPNHPYIEFN